MITGWVKQLVVILGQLDTPDYNENTDIDIMLLEEHGSDFFGNARAIQTSVSIDYRVNRNENINRHRERQDVIANTSNCCALNSVVDDAI